MSEKQSEKEALNRLDQIDSALKSGTATRVQTLLATLNAAETGRVLESLPPDKRCFLWQLVDAEQRGSVLSHVKEGVRASLIEATEDDTLLEVAAGMSVHNLANVFNALPEMVTREVLASMDSQDRQRLESILSYPHDSAGGLMNTDAITVRPNVTIDVVSRYLRRRNELPPLTDALSVVDRDDKLMGTLPLSVILTSDPTKTVEEVMFPGSLALLVSTPSSEVATYFEVVRDLVSVPVVDEANRLLGRITIDDVVDAIRDEANQNLMRLAGLDDNDDMFAPVLRSTSKRAVWLGVNLLTALLASWVIGLYEAALDKIVALAVLMPIVASMGGIAGSQTLTLVIRGMALGQLGQSNAGLLLFKEVSVGTLNGLLWAVMVSLVAYLWFGDEAIGAIIAAALIVNLIAATASGVIIPLILKKLGIDPALAGSVILTTVTDVVGFMTFLGLATIVLL